MKKFLFLLCMFSVPSFAQIDFNADNSSSEKNYNYTDKQKKDLNSLYNFINVAGANAGAMGVCNPSEVKKIKSCVLFYVSKTLSDITDEKEKLKQAQKTRETWLKSLNYAYKLQNSATPPSSCNDIIEEEKKSPIWEICPNNSVFDELLKHSSSDIQNESINIQ